MTTDEVIQWCFSLVSRLKKSAYLNGKVYLESVREYYGDGHPDDENPNVWIQVEPGESRIVVCSSINSGYQEIHIDLVDLLNEIDTLAGRDLP
jgi:hypothetical protein